MERRWREACKTENESCIEDPIKYNVLRLVPTDSELASAFAERKRRFGFTYSIASQINIQNV